MVKIKAWIKSTADVEEDEEEIMFRSRIFQISRILFEL